MNGSGRPAARAGIEASISVLKSELLTFPYISPVAHGGGSAKLPSGRRRKLIATLRWQTPE